MSILTSLGIIVFSMLILMSLQLIPGIFALVTHYAFGKYSAKKASDLALFFIIGVESAFTITILLVYLMLTTIYSVIPNINILTWIICGIIAALGLASFFFYYRKGDNSELFISRSLAKNINIKARSIKKRSDAFILGFLSPLPELIFTIPLYVAASIAIVEIGENTIARAGLVSLFVFLTIIPILFYQLFSQHYNLATYLRFRFKNKTFFRVFISIMYFILAIFIIIGAVT